MNHPFDPKQFGFAEEPTVELRLGDASATRALGAAVGVLLSSGGFVGLVGNLGAGKTTFVQGLVTGLDPDAEASSPTYTLLNEYHLDPAVWHFDLYRLESTDELETIGYWDYAEDRSAIVLVEWIDRIPAAWLGRGMIIELRHTDTERLARVWGAQTAVLASALDEVRA